MSSKLFSIVVCVIVGVDGHARLWDPPGRATMWRRGYKTPVDLDDNQQFCGGYGKQWAENDGKCGVCGDAWDDGLSGYIPRQHETGGKYGTAMVVARYLQGQRISVKVDVTADHQGYIELKLCRVFGKHDRATQRCMDKNVLKLAGTNESRFYVTKKEKMYEINVHLPEDLVCDRCVMQFKYHTGNSWGRCENGTEGLGCGKQEHFYGCADIQVLPKDEALGDDNNIETGMIPPEKTEVQISDDNTVPEVEDKDESAIADSESEELEWLDGCSASGIWKKIPGIQDWCGNNCLKKQPREDCSIYCKNC